MPEEPKKLGKYTIVGEIGRGAMGQIYKGHDPVLNRYVAIKTIAETLGTDADLVERFRREARSAAQLNHPNIVTIYEFVEEEGTLYMVMELLEGEDLKQLIQKGDPLTVDRLLGIMEQIADGLGYAHETGMVHRDLKPANVHISKKGQVKILDFGLVHESSSDMTKTGHVLGTPNYMSPEQVQGFRIDARSDIFSLGAVFYEMLTRKKPFSAESVHATMYKVVQGDREPLSTYRHLPAPIVDLVEQALDPVPENRFADARSLREELRKVRQELVKDSSDPGSMTLGQAEAETLLETSTVGSRRSTPPRERGAAARSGAGSSPSGRGVGASRSRGTIRSGQAIEAGTSVAARRADRPTARYALLGLLGILVVGIGTGGYFLLSPAVEERSDRTVADLSRALVESQQRLMHQSLEQRDYAAAIVQARELLENDPGNAEALRVQRDATERLESLERSVSEARDALERGNTERAAEALSRVLALDPEHPVGAELSSQLDQHFQSRAESARAEMERVREAARNAGAGGETAFDEADRLMQRAAAEMGRAEYTSAAQGFLVARDRYQEALTAFRAARASRRAEGERRARADEARAAQQARVREARDAYTRLKEQPSPAGLTSQPSYARATAEETTAERLADSGDWDGAVHAYEGAAAHLQAARRELSQARARQSEEARLAEEREARRAAAGTASAPAPPTRAQEETAIRRVLAQYERALESKDLPLFRSVKPNLTADEEQRLQQSFEQLDSHDVEMTIHAIDIQADQATVDVTRRDTIVVQGRSQNGSSREQRFTLSKSSGHWVIVTIGP